MHVKRLYRPTVREALAAARAELGPAALVLSTELVPAQGWRGWLGQRVVRLTAASERPQTTADLTQLSTDLVSELRPDVTADRHQTLAGPRAGVAARLQAAGLSQSFAEAVAQRLSIAECRGGSDAALQRALAEELDAVRGDDEHYARCEVFVGPPGVGKTTTIAKIAAQERAGRARPLGLVAADAFRAGAVEQLRSYASVIGVPFRVARSAAELDQALDATRQTAFIDTAGRSPNDSSLTDLFDVIGRRKTVRTHLVMAADTSMPTAERLLARYAPLKPSRVVITKLDEAHSVIPLFNLVRERNLPVSWIAAGQRVPEDLLRATPASLATMLLQETNPEGLACH